MNIISRQTPLKRFLSVFVVLAMCFSLLPVDVFTADVFADDTETEYIFTVQPQDVVYDNSAEEVTVHWDINIQPDYYYVMVPLIDNPNNLLDNIYSQKISGNEKEYTFKGTYFRDNDFYIQAYAGGKQVARTRTFKIRNKNLFRFTSEPGPVVNIDPETLLYDISWGYSFPTGFIPEKYTITFFDEFLINYYNGHPKDVIVDERSSNGEWGTDTHAGYLTMSTQLDAWRDKGYLSTEDSGSKCYRVRLYYGSGEDDFIESEKFILSDSSLVFESSPVEEVCFDSDNINYPLSWKTNFVPTQVVVKRTYKDYYEQYTVEVAKITEGLDKEMGYDLPPESKIYTDTSNDVKYEYLIQAYYAAGEYIESSPFVLNGDGFSFIEKPGEVMGSDVIGYHHDEKRYLISWETGFLPKKVEIVNSSDKIIETLQDTTAQIIVKKKDARILPRELYAPGKYTLRAYYSDDNYISADFTLAAPDYKFTEQPEDSEFNYVDKTYYVQFCTNFTPFDDKVEVWKVKENSLSEKVHDLKLKSVNSEDPSNQLFVVGLNGAEGYYEPGKYYIKLYYTDIDDRGVTCTNPVVSQRFTLAKRTMEFTQQPQNVLISGNSAKGPLITWKTNFTPVELKIEYSNNGTVDTWDFSSDPTITSTEALNVEGGYRILAKPAGYDDFIESKWFSIVKESFSEQPSQNDRDIVARFEGECGFYWQLYGDRYHLQPNMIQVIYYPVDSPNDVTTVTLDKTDRSYTLQSTNNWEDYECYIRVWVSENEGDYIDSDKFIVHMQGSGFSVEPNKGTPAPVIHNGEQSYYMTNHVECDDSGYAIIPECIMTPPAGMMFDGWAIVDDKLMYMVQAASANEGYNFVTRNFIKEFEYK
ncbi:MAG: hypothetical protein K6G68_06335, partial [Oscillospiraceae bacterium]|nr:hypothetical protein [Oscillospiraceae bacterium]